MSVDLGICYNKDLSKVLKHKPDILVVVFSEMLHSDLFKIFRRGYVRRQSRLALCNKGFYGAGVVAFSKSRDLPKPINCKLVYLGPAHLHEQSWIYQTQASTVVTTIDIPFMRDFKGNIRYL